MKFELKDFQFSSALKLIDELEEARAAAAKSKLQAVVLSAPTGSGKTITIAAVIDWLFGGGEGVSPRPQTTFLWLSDSPELNVQSKNKLLAACDNVPFHKIVTVDSESFDEERLQAGNVYFINTQLLGKDKLLTKGGDGKSFTFWETVANTIEASPQDFVLIIDEAHRGAGVSEGARKTIMQKFITGSEADNLPPVPIVLGMSATPQRFTELLGSAARTQRPVNITAEMVRESGLLKDLIIVHHPEVAAHTDLTLLESAAERWVDFEKRWGDYCQKEKEKEAVRPVLVVQVQDGSEGVLTRTPLDDVVQVLERKMGKLAPNEIVHCFQDNKDIQHGGRIIRRIEASRIQDSADVKVVLFKTALTTGWDCPRAEIMMSFRRAQDATSIAQLVGRMIRTPLARRVESDETLNTVELFLPHYDSETLESVLKQLRSPEEHEGTGTEVALEAVSYARAPKSGEVFTALGAIPTYAVDRAPKLSAIKRLLRLSGMLALEDIDQNADENARELLVSKLKSMRDDLAANDPDWAKTVKEGGEIEVAVTSVAVGAMSVAGQKKARVTLSDENIDQLFDEAGRRLASGEGLHRTYWKRYHDQAKPSLAKLELFAVVRREASVAALEQLAQAEFDKLWAARKAEIKAQPAAVRKRFDKLVQASGKATKQDWELPDCIVLKPGPTQIEKHLYQALDGTYSTKLNTWESEFLALEMAREDFLYWLRNIPRRDWAFCVPYDHQGEKPHFPDFILVRKKGDGFEVDLLEPHDDTRTDTWAKAKGLAKYADEHPHEFARILIGRKKDGKLQIIDVADATTREKVRKIGSPAELEALFKLA